MGKNTDLTNYERYLNNLKIRGYDKLSPPLKEESINDLIAEGDRLLEAEAKKSTVKAKKSTSNTTTSNNPYRQARLKILSEMDKSQRTLIETLEKEGKKDSREYLEFVKNISTLGDKLSGQ